MQRWLPVSRNSSKSVSNETRAQGMSLLTTMIGLGAAICTTSSFLPQVINAWHSRSTHDISVGMFILQTSGNFMWLFYGALTSDLPLVVADAIRLALVPAIPALKLRYG
jgi:MtN3 and saliva related transmembrane protein